MDYSVDISEQILYQTYPKLLEKILLDKTTKENIIWATDNYEHLGENYGKASPITIKSITGLNSGIIKPRSLKDKYIQTIRTKDKGEVFTPSWVCNKQNNLIDEAWFGRKDVFNIETKKGWKTNHNRIIFPKNKTWKDYVKDTRLEISCGEAPYLVSRYDTVTGKIISINDRIGLLDRKLRVISENIEKEDEWLDWVYEAYKNIYGYELQGDNLILARENLIFTFIDYLMDKFNREPRKQELNKLINIICWNIWQMDGLSMTVPFRKETERTQQISMFNFNSEPKSYNCRIYDWKANKSIEFRSLVKNK